MIVTAERDQTVDRLPELPAGRSKVITKDRQIVDTSGETWKFRASGDGGRLLIIDWSRFRERGYPLRVSDRALHIAKLYVACRLTFSKGMTVWNDSGMFHRFFRWYGRSRQRQSTEAFDWSLVTEEISVDSSKKG